VARNDRVRDPAGGDEHDRRFAALLVFCAHNIPRSASHQSGILEIGIPHGYPPAGRRAPDRLDLGTVVLSAVGFSLSAFGIYILARARFARL
jgi:hypothetical protein